jgi:UDP-N-acetylglucosamine--N-acetylmuramyl-(pentapeptide) pyrophosphoryl-undecaprenol N-acetylglucosamine transferase
VIDASGLCFVLAAGGTGGHLFPAQALAERLVAAGATVHLATDRRADAFAASVPGVTISEIWAGRLGGGPIQTAWGAAEMAIGLVQAQRLLRRLDPDAVVGFGGYPSVPTMLAAIRLGYPTIIHEQNAVLGRANRLLAKRVKRIATGFANTAAMRDADRSRVVHTGNPVRPAILAVANTPYRPPAPGGPIEILVLGGSQGARIFADIVPPALAGLPPEFMGTVQTPCSSSSAVSTSSSTSHCLRILTATRRPKPARIRERKIFAASRWLAGFRARLRARYCRASCSSLLSS